MKILYPSKSIFFVTVFLISIGSIANSNHFFVLHSANLFDSLPHTEGMSLEIYKVKSNKKFTINKNRLVRIHCYGKNGQSGLKRARITEITADEITFTPTSKKFDEVTYSKSSLNYIEFITWGTMARGVIVNTVVISVVVIETAATS